MSIFMDIEDVHLHGYETCSHRERREHLSPVVPEGITRTNKLKRHQSKYLKFFFPKIDPDYNSLQL